MYFMHSCISCKSCTDAIFMLKQVIENNIEYNKNLFIAFVDQEKAFDTVRRKMLWQTLT